MADETEGIVLDGAFDSDDDEYDEERGTPRILTVRK